MEIEHQASYDAAQMKDDLSGRRNKSLSTLPSEDTFWALVELIPDAVIAHDGNKIIYHNSAASKLFGATNETDLLGRDPLSLAHPDEHEEILAMRAEAIGRAPLGGRKSRRHVRLDGTSFYSRNIFVNFGVVEDPGYLVILRDISDSDETKRVLELGNEQFRRGFEDAPIGMMIVETDATIRHANSAFCDMLGYSLTT